MFTLIFFIFGTNIFHSLNNLHAKFHRGINIESEVTGTQIAVGTIKF